jgi:la-related protein 1
MAAATSPALPAFSYAQAAKGRAPATSVAQSQAESSQNTPDLPSNERRVSTERKASAPNSELLDSLHTTVSVDKHDEVSDHLESKAVRDDVESASTTKSTSDNNSSSNTKQSSLSHSDSKQISESTSSSLVASVATLPREDEDSSTPNGSSEAWDKQSEISATAEKSGQTGESGKERGVDEDWVNVPAPRAEKELKAAPIPAVNIWEQRKEAQKAKANIVSRSTAPLAAPVKSKPQTQPVRNMEGQIYDDETKRKPAGKPVEKGDGSLKKKHAEDTKTRDDGKCSSVRSKSLLLTCFIGKRLSRQGRANEAGKDITETSTAPPPVGDSAFWPTPEIANHEDRKKFQAQDKADKGDLKSPGMKPNQKWVPVPYVPTAKFNTPLPPTISRRGGRPARGSREAGNRGGHMPHGSITDKPDKLRTMGPPPVAKQASEQQRGRDQETSTSNRATSAPSQGRRAASVGPALNDQQRSNQTAIYDRGLFESNGHGSSEAQDTPVSSTSLGNGEGASSSKSRADSRSYSRHSSLSQRTGTHENVRHVSGESHAHPRSHAGTERRNTYGDLERHSEAPGRRDRGESNKDTHKLRDFDFKADSWRDRDFAGEKSEPRNGRGRGGYRGRGNNSTYVPPQSNQTHAFTAPLPQQPFSANKPHAYGERHRQSSAPYSGMPPPTNHRGASRSQSIPNHGIYPGAPGNFGSPLSPIQTDVHGLYGGFSTMYPGVMSAMPYNAALEPMALISMVAAQLEYYFSIENLCKDMYLRSHMDSQGWVPLTVVAGFNRIKSLTEDMNLIRYVCQTSRTIEFRPGDDGTDRVRKVDKWDQWILDFDQRQAHAQNDGPPPLQGNHSPQRINPIFPSMSQMTSPTWAPGSFYNGYAEAPSFNPAGPLSETQNTSPPVSGNLPDIPPSEEFSLSNGRAEVSPDKPADVPCPSSPSLIQNTVTNGSSPANDSVAAVSAHTPTSPQEIGVENAFSNERMNELHVCVRHPTDHFQPPFVTSAARTFSHGSIDDQLPVNAQTANSMPSLRGGGGSPEM